MPWSNNRLTKVDLTYLAVLHLYGFVVGRASVAEIKNQKDQPKKTSIDKIDYLDII